MDNYIWSSPSPPLVLAQFYEITTCRFNLYHYFTCNNCIFSSHNLILIPLSSLGEIHVSCVSETLVNIHFRNLNAILLVARKSLYFVKITLTRVDFGGKTHRCFQMVIRHHVTEHL